MTADDTPFVARCPDCDERTTVADPNEVVALYRRHHAVTGHDVTWERTPSLGADVPADPDVDAVVAALGDPDAALGAVSAAASEWGWTVGETLDAVHDRRLTGALWEPRDDHVAVV